VYPVLQFVIQMNVVYPLLQFLIRMYAVGVVLQFAIQIVPFIQNYILIQINVMISTVYFPIQIDLLTNVNSVYPMLQCLIHVGVVFPKLYI
jgi:hypothetical protein